MAINSSFLIQANDVSCIAQGQLLLQNISLEIYPNQLMTLIGPNGAGKTTLLKVLLGLIPTTRGSIIKRSDLKIGYMPQKLMVDQSMPLSVEDFLNLSSPTNSLDRVLAQVNMASHRKTLMHYLSGGEFQRTLMAKALLSNPDLLILDEPVQGVDIVGQEELYALVETIRHQQGCSILLVSHDLHFVHRASDQVVCLNQHICCQGRPIDIQQNPNYVSLFGQTFATKLARYTHNHDHRHDGINLKDAN